ncbi:MAG: hypothetical protein IKN04_17840 [Clostridia bacterium]|nr:hypothetical protein [Clostridia bacterium]
MPTQRSITQMRYDKEKSRHYGMKLNMKTDADIIAVLDEQPSFQGFIKQLVRDYIAAQAGREKKAKEAP